MTTTKLTSNLLRSSVLMMLVGSGLSSGSWGCSACPEIITCPASVTGPGTDCSKMVQECTATTSSPSWARVGEARENTVSTTYRYCTVAFGFTGGLVNCKMP